MAKLDGGIFSRPRGTTAGVVFGAARTRTGKVATARQLVPPSNPNTEPQQRQRSKFKVAQEIVRGWGPGVYQNAFNRSVSQLPGFQSMQSIMTKAIDDDYKIVPPPPTRLGTMPDIADLVTEDGGDFGQIDVFWDINTIPPGYTAETKIHVLVTATDTGNDDDGGKVSEFSAVYGDGNIQVTDLVAGEDYLIGVYAEGVGTSEGNYNTAVWSTGTAGT